MTSLYTHHSSVYTNNSYLNFRFSINCSIVTSSRSTKSDFPNSKPSSSAIPTGVYPKDERMEITEENDSTEEESVSCCPLKAGREDKCGVGVV